MEVELLCLNERLSDSRSPPRIYFNSLFARTSEDREQSESADKLSSSQHAQKQ